MYSEFVNGVEKRKETLQYIYNSYTGNDADIKDMLLKLNQYINYIYDNRLSLKNMSESELSAYDETNTKNYSNAQAAINKCISRFALYDKTGLQ